MIGEIQTVPIAGCASCRGILFQQAALAQLVQHLRATSSLTVLVPDPLDCRQLQLKRTCPSCLEPFETHAYGGAGNAVIDTCCRCGLIWLDTGELTKLVRAPGKR